MNVAVNGKPFKEELSPIIQGMFDHLKSKNIDVQLNMSFKENCRQMGIKIPKHSIFSNLHELLKADFAISIGGDGTLLDTVAHIGKMEIPILGINMGRLGYLATTNREDITQAIDRFLEGSYELDNRALVTLETKDQLFGSKNFALNEVAIIKRDTSSMIHSEIYVDGEFLNSYWADGVIVSTPTGSTGYSMSCGGPIVLPGSQNLIITPICPHNLNLRPLIISDRSHIRLKIIGATKSIMVSLDSRSETVPANMELNIYKSEFDAHLIKFDETKYFNTLREKLNWGKDLRN